MLRSFLLSLLFTPALNLVAQQFNMQLRSKVEYPNQTVANVFGYWQGGREYALVGASGGMSIVDITNPDAPLQIAQFPGPESQSNGGELWREIKVYRHCAYMVTEAGGGIQVVDLSVLPSPAIPHYSFTGEGPAAGTISRVHALHVDTTKGYLYIYGAEGSVGSGAIVFDLNEDPYHPVYAGVYKELGYIHDGYVDNDTLYAAHIGAGLVAMVDMSNKTNPVVLGTVETPGRFPHNTWLTDDRKHILTTDEINPSFLTLFDVSDPEDIRELDRISSNDGYHALVHNTTVFNDYAVTAWYQDGVVTVDAHRPENLVIVGWFDAYPQGNGSGECWGAFPFFPSGTIIASNIEPGELLVLTPEYKRACYFEGVVTDACNGFPIPNARVEISGSTDPKKIVLTKTDGSFRTGQASPGNFTATFSATGFPPETINITLNPGEITFLNLVLGVNNNYTYTGTVRDQETNLPLEGAVGALITPDSVRYLFETDVNGEFNVLCAYFSQYNATVGKWGYGTQNLTANEGNHIQVSLVSNRYFDDFDLPLGWKSGGTSPGGLWTWGKPNGTTLQNNFVNPDSDALSDDNEYCYVTGNQENVGPYADEVDLGYVALTTPVINLADYNDALFSFDYWFFSFLPVGNDLFEVNLIKNGQKFRLFTETVSASEWRHSPVIHLADFTTLSDSLFLEFVATEVVSGHIVEAGVDLFKIEGITTGAGVVLNESARCTVSPNPSSASFSIDYQWDNLAGELRLEVRDILGRVVEDLVLPAEKGLIQLGDRWTPGVYMVTLRSGQEMGRAVRLVKQ